MLDSKYENLNLSYNLLKDELDDLIISKNIINNLCASLIANKHVILEGHPGTGKTELAIRLSEVAKLNNVVEGYILTTATSDWSTFDVVGGWMPDEDNFLKFNRGKFLEAIASNKWLIIDEINRADIDKAFGQLFTVLSGQNVELPYTENGKCIKIELWDKKFSKYDEETATYYIGSNWRIIGTMNVDDKDNLFDLSYAFIRRFMFIEIDIPNDNDYYTLIERWCGDLDEVYITKLLDLQKIVKFKKIGPAIFKDMIDYIKFKEELLPKDHNSTLSEAISSYMLPQFEGINKQKVAELKKFFEELNIFSFIEDEFNNFFKELY